MPTSKKQKKKLLMRIVRWGLTVVLAPIGLLLTLSYVRIPAHESWNAVEQHFNRQVKAGTQVVFSPPYLLNYARESHGGRFNRFDTRRSPDKATSLFPSYWVIATHELVEYADVVEFDDGIWAYQVDFEGYTPYNTFATKEFLSGAASVTTKNDAKACTVGRDGFRCGRAPWEKIHLVRFMVEGDPLQCIFVHPYPNADLHLDYSELPAGKLVFGFEDFGANDIRNREPVTIDVNGKAVVMTPEDRYQEMDFPAGELHLTVATKNPRRRHVCFNLLY